MKELIEKYKKELEELDIWSQNNKEHIRYSQNRIKYNVLLDVIKDLENLIKTPTNAPLADVSKSKDSAKATVCPTCKEKMKPYYMCIPCLRSLIT